MRWIKGAKRECRECGAEIKNLSRDVGEVRSVYPGPRRDILCMSCHLQRARRLIERTRRELGLEE